MHHFVTEMCTHVRISVTKWCIVGYEIGDLWIRGQGLFGLRQASVASLFHGANSFAYYPEAGGWGYACKSVE